jgi:hypothetical protein
MKIYWTQHSIPELAEIPRKERGQIVRAAASGKLGRSPMFWVGILVMVLGMIVASFGAIAVSRLGFFPGATPGQSISYIVLACMLAQPLTLLAVIVGNQFIFRALLPHVRAHLKTYCPACGYNLTGNLSGTCPECGQAVEKKA